MTLDNRVPMTTNEPMIDLLTYPIETEHELTKQWIQEQLQNGIQFV